MDTQVSIGKYRLDKYSDEDIQIYNARLVEGGVSRSIIETATKYYNQYHLNKDLYLKVLDVLQNDEIIDKGAYIYRMVSNEQNEKVYA